MTSQAGLGSGWFQQPQPRLISLPIVHGKAVASFDDERVVANAGVLLLASRLGVVDLVDEWLSLGDVPGATNDGWKAGSIVPAMPLLRRDRRLRGAKAGQSEAVLGFAAAGTVNVWNLPQDVRVRQLDRVLAKPLRPASAAGAGEDGANKVVTLAHEPAAL